MPWGGTMHHRLTALLAVLTATVTWAIIGIVSGSAVNTASAAPTFTRTVAVNGIGAAMYPAFDAATTRYALTTDDTTGGSVIVHAHTTDPAGKVYVDGVPLY